MSPPNFLLITKEKIVTLQKRKCIKQYINQVIKVNMYIYVCVYIYILFICYIYFSLVLFLTNTIDYNRFCFLIKLVITIESGTVGLPWWFSGKESTCQCRRHWFDLWSGKMPCAVEQLSSCITTIELVL